MCLCPSIQSCLIQMCNALASVMDIFYKELDRKNPNFGNKYDDDEPLEDVDDLLLMCMRAFTYPLFFNYPTPFNNPYF